jgi:hypothetical protein
MKNKIHNLFYHYRTIKHPQWTDYNVWLIQRRFFLSSGWKFYCGFFVDYKDAIEIIECCENKEPVTRGDQWNDMPWNWLTNSYYSKRINKEKLINECTITIVEPNIKL